MLRSIEASAEIRGRNSLCESDLQCHYYLRSSDDAKFCLRKRIKKSRNTNHEIERELSVMLEVVRLFKLLSASMRLISSLMQVDHPQCVRLLEVYDTEHEVVLVMEMATGGELFETILEKTKRKTTYTEPEAALIFQKVVKAVVYLHSKGIVHRDIKPENILLMSENDETEVKLADFNLSIFLGPDTDVCNQCIGTMGYCGKFRSCRVCMHSMFNPMSI